MDKPRVVIVDTYRERAQSVVDALGAGFDCRLVDGADDAIQTIREARPAAVVVDFPFPTEDKRCLSAVLREDPTTSGIGVVAYSGWDYPNTRSKAAAFGCDTFVGRSEGPEAVARALGGLFERRQEHVA